MTFQTRYQILMIAAPIALFMGSMALVRMGWFWIGGAPLFLAAVFALLAPRCPGCRRPVFFSSPSVMTWRAPKTCDCGHDYRKPVSSATSGSRAPRD